MVFTLQSTAPEWHPPHVAAQPKEPGPIAPDCHEASGTTEKGTLEDVQESTTKVEVTEEQGAAFDSDALYRNILEMQEDNRAKMAVIERLVGVLENDQQLRSSPSGSPAASPRSSHATENDKYAFGIPYAPRTSSDIAKDQLTFKDVG